MMRYDETDDANQKKPFRTLLGHRLVMDERGNPMHKSDGTAIWFEEAAEQLGVDTLRWMYLAQNPASDLRFGTRHPDEPVELITPEGPISETKEGLPTCKVTSKPADEIRRQVLIPLWNSYAFFINYAVADEFDPTIPQVELHARPEIDRWILSRLQELTETAKVSFEAYDVASFMSAATTFIDDLSNWYIRRSRRRFWRFRERTDELKVPFAGWETEKLSAYQTLYDVLLTLSKLLAPCVPFLCERMYQNLATGNGTPESVHLCDYSTVDMSKLDPDLNWRTQQVQAVVRIGHRLRETAGIRVRQPLAKLRCDFSDEKQRHAIMQATDIIKDELNVKFVDPMLPLAGLVTYSYKPNLKTLGPKYGKLLGTIRKELPEVDAAVMAPLRDGNPVTLTFGGEEVTLEPNDVLISTEQASDWASGDDGGIQVALSTALTPELIREGMARDFVRHIQQSRKDAGLDITDRIRVNFATKDAEAEQAVGEWSDYIRAETLADAIEQASQPSIVARQVSVGDAEIQIWIERVQ